MINYCSQDNNNIRQEQDFMGNCFQLQVISYKNFGEFPRTRGKGTSKSPTKSPDYQTTTKDWQKERKPLRNSVGEARAAHLDKRYQRKSQEQIP